MTNVSLGVAASVVALMFPPVFAAESAPDDYDSLLQQCDTLTATTGKEYVYAEVDVGYLSPPRLVDGTACTSACPVVYNIMGLFHTYDIKARFLTVKLFGVLGRTVPPASGDIYAFCYVRDPDIEDSVPMVHKGKFYPFGKGSGPTVHLMANDVLRVKHLDTPPMAFGSDPHPLLTPARTTNTLCDDLNRRFDSHYHYGEATIARIVEAVPPTHTYQGTVLADQPKRFMVEFTPVGTNDKVTATIAGIDYDFASLAFTLTAGTKYGFCYSMTPSNESGMPHVVTIDRPETFSVISQ